MNARAERVASLLRIQRSIGLKTRPRKRLPRQLFPTNLEREYTARLRLLLRSIMSDLAPVLAEAPRLLTTATYELQRVDSEWLLLTPTERVARHDAGESRRLRELIAEARRRMAGKLTDQALDDIAEQIGRGVSGYNRVQLMRQIRAAVGADIFLADKKLPTLLENFVAQNVALIRDIPVKLVGEVERSISRAMQMGLSHRELAKDLADRLDISDTRAATIARDQIGTLNGQINASRQQDLGVEKFIWRTVGDERVREEHDMRDGETYSYDDPPDGELPGEPILCRCSAEPVFDFLGDE